MKTFIPSFAFVLMALSSTFASAQEPITFTGKLTHSRYRELLGRECTIRVTPTDETDAGTWNRSNVELKIQGVGYLLQKRKAPKKTMFLYYARDKKGVYFAQGGKYRHEGSQQLFVSFDASETKITKWQYRDGTVEFFGLTYICE